MTEGNEVRTLARGDSQIMGGVCSGIAEYYGLKTGGVRVGTFLLCLCFFLPIIVYFVLWMALPNYASTQFMQRHLKRNAKSRGR